MHIGHIKALEILVWVLDDMHAAEAYCFKSCRDTSQSGMDASMLLALVRVLLTPPRSLAAPPALRAQGCLPSQVNAHDANLSHVLSLLER